MGVKKKIKSPPPHHVDRPLNVLILDYSDLVFTRTRHEHRARTFLNRSLSLTVFSLPSQLFQLFLAFFFTFREFIRALINFVINFKSFFVVELKRECENARSYGCYEISNVTKVKSMKNFAMFDTERDSRGWYEGAPPLRSLFLFLSLALSSFSFSVSFSGINRATFESFLGRAAGLVDRKIIYEVYKVERSVDEKIDWNEHSTRRQEK